MRRTLSLGLFALALAGCEAPAPVPAVPSPTIPLADPPNSNVICLLFLGRDCPISDGYSLELAKLAKDYSLRGVAFVGLIPDADVTPAECEVHVKEFGLPFEVRPDRDRKTARAAGATNVPQAVVYRDGARVYSGRIDDRYSSVGGKRREHPTRHDLREALDAILAGLPVTVPETTAVGCWIDLDSP